MRALKNLILSREDGRKNISLRRTYNDMARLAGGKIYEWKFRLPSYDITTEDDMYTTFRYELSRGAKKGARKKKTSSSSSSSSGTSSSSSSSGTPRWIEIRVENPLVTLQSKKSSSSAAAAGEIINVRIRMDMFTIPDYLQTPKLNGEICILKQVPILFIGDEVSIDGTKYTVIGPAGGNYVKSPDSSRPRRIPTTYMDPLQLEYRAHHLTLSDANRVNWLPTSFAQFPFTGSKLFLSEQYKKKKKKKDEAKKFEKIKEIYDADPEAFGKTGMSRFKDSKAEENDTMKAIRKRSTAYKYITLLKRLYFNKSLAQDVVIDKMENLTVQTELNNYHTLTEEKISKGKKAFGFLIPPIKEIVTQSKLGKGQKLHDKKLLGVGEYKFSEEQTIDDYKPPLSKSSKKKKASPRSSSAPKKKKARRSKPDDESGAAAAADAVSGISSGPPDDTTRNPSFDTGAAAASGDTSMDDGARAPKKKKASSTASAAHADEAGLFDIRGNLDKIFGEEGVSSALFGPSRTPSMSFEEAVAKAASDDESGAAAAADAVSGISSGPDDTSLPATGFLGFEGPLSRTPSFDTGVRLHSPQADTFEDNGDAAAASGGTGEFELDKLLDSMHGGGDSDNTACITSGMTDPYGVLIKATQNPFVAYIWVEHNLLRIPEGSQELKLYRPNGDEVNGWYNRKTMFWRMLQRMMKHHDKPAYTFGQYLFKCSHHNLKVPRLPPENTTYKVYLDGTHYFNLKRTSLKKPSKGFTFSSSSSTATQIAGDEPFEFYGLFAAKHFKSGDIVTMYDGYLFKNEADTGYQTNAAGKLTGTPPRAATLRGGFFLDAQTRDAQLRPVLEPEAVECFGFAQFINHAAALEEGASSSSAAASPAASPSANCRITDVGGIQVLEHDIPAGTELFVDYGEGYNFDNEAKRKKPDSDRLEPIPPTPQLINEWRTYSKFKPNNWTIEKVTADGTTVPYPGGYVSGSVDVQPSGASAATSKSESSSSSSSGAAYSSSSSSVAV